MNASVDIGSRSEWWRYLTYCSADENLQRSPFFDPKRPQGKFPWGSSASNNDHSKHNLVMQNRIYKRPVELMIRQGDSSSRPNLIAYNETVIDAQKRSAGCYLANGLTNFLKHGERSDLAPDANVIPRCAGKRQTCSDGVLSSELGGNCRLQRVAFDCSVTGDNDGCRERPLCAQGDSVPNRGVAFLRSPRPPALAGLVMPPRLTG